MNTFGNNLRLTTFGESHGPYMGGVLDGFPAGFVLASDMLVPFMQRRRPGSSDAVSARSEDDSVEIISGVFEGRTLGSPIAFLIKNSDTRSSDYTNVSKLFRPGHADYTYAKKYGHRDWRGGGRASARETVVRVAAGAMAQLALNSFGITIESYLTQIGPIKANSYNYSDNKFNFANNQQLADIEDLLATLKQQGDSCGASVRTVISGAPVGLGGPIYNKLSGHMSSAMMSINAVKAVSIGLGFESVAMYGSQTRDAMDDTGFTSNHAGGVLGGISTGEPIVIETAFKPTSSIKKQITTQDENGSVTTSSVSGRHDPCVGIRAAPICSAMASLVILDHMIARYGELGIQERLLSSSAASVDL